MKTRLISLLLLLSVFGGCIGQNRQVPPAITTATPLVIHRFDKTLFTALASQDTIALQNATLLDQQMLDLIAQGILNRPKAKATDFYEKLMRYYAEPTLRGLYADAIQQYEEISATEDALGRAFTWFNICFPDRKSPAISMHVSGFQQNILAGDNLISISIDKYLGETYPLYQSFFYEHQRRRMVPQQVVPDLLIGWLMTEFPFEGKENVLLDRMIYEGKLRWLIHHALPEIPSTQLMGYTDAELAWCEANESAIWRTIIERKHLYTPDQLTTAKYFDTASSSFIADEAPGLLGIWIGWQIVDHYMQQNDVSPLDLMQIAPQPLLSASKYK